MKEVHAITLNIVMLLTFCHYYYDYYYYKGMLTVIDGQNPESSDLPSDMSCQILHFVDRASCYDSW
jgi:hypothetical protein